MVEFSSAGGLTRSTPSASAAIGALLPTEGEGVARRPAEHGDLAAADARVEHVGEALAERAQVLADHRRVVLTGDEGTFLAGQSDVARREGQVRDPGGLRFGDRAGEGDPGVGIPDDEVGAALDQEPDVVGRHFRIRVEVGGGRDDLADLGVRQRLQDGLHVAHRTPDVHRVAATVGVAHDEVATRSGVARLGAPALHRLVDRGLVEVLVGPGDGGEDDVPTVVGRGLDRAEGLGDERRIRRARVLAVVGQGAAGGARPLRSASRPGCRAGGHGSRDGQRQQRGDPDGTFHVHAFLPHGR